MNAHAQHASDGERHTIGGRRRAADPLHREADLDQGRHRIIGRIKVDNGKAVVVIGHRVTVVGNDRPDELLYGAATGIGDAAAQEQAVLVVWSALHGDADHAAIAAIGQRLAVCGRLGGHGCHMEAGNAACDKCDDGEKTEEVTFHKNLCLSCDFGCQQPPP